MKLPIALFAAVSGLALPFALKAEPTPTPTPTPTPKRLPIRIPGKSTPAPKPTPIPIPGGSPRPGPIQLNSPVPSATPIKIPKGGGGSGGRPGPIQLPTPTPTVEPIKIPGKITPTPTGGPIKIPGKITPTPTVGPIKIPGKVTPTPTVGPIKIPGKITPTPTVGPKLIPGGPFELVTPTPSPTLTVGPGLQYSPSKKKKKGLGKNDVSFWLNIDLAPPPPSQLGPTLVIPSIPVYQEVPASSVNFVPGGVAPVPETYVPPPQDAPVEITPTALRAWNGLESEEERAFDQTRVKLAGTGEGNASWQFFWKTTGPEPQATRWEVATVPFVGGVTDFPPAGLVGYGDASPDADSSLTENFFAIDFNGFAKNFEEGAVPDKYYMRVVPVDGEGNPIGKPSNFVRVDLP